MYKADDLYSRMMAAFRAKYPQFETLRMIVSGEVGSGKSVVLAAFPVEGDKKRVVLDMEDSMAYLDAGPDGNDIYTRRRQSFRMNRKSFPEVTDLANFYQAIKKNPEEIGVLAIDNIAVLQETISSWALSSAADYNALKTVFSKMDAASALPNPGLVRAVWSKGPDPSFWSAIQALPKALMLMCMKSGVHFIASTEEGNVWQNYGTQNAKVIGKKAKMWQVWFRYVDTVVSLQRDVNKTDPPKGQLFPYQPKLRIQGLNPSWTMDWEGFITELENSIDRTEGDIPEEAQADVAVVGGE